MTPLIRKEIRLLLPFLAIALALAVIPIWVFNGAGYMRWNIAVLPGGVIWAFGFGMVLLGLAPFGQEFSLNTFPLLLAQPSERRKIWTVKTALVFTASLVVLLAFVLSMGAWCHAALTGALHSLQMLHLGHLGVDEASTRHGYMALFWRAGGKACLLALVAATGGLWTTLLFRQTGAALWFTILVPGVISGSVEWFLPDTSARNIVTFATLGIYSLAGFLWARRMFLDAQDAQWIGGTVSLSGLSPAKAQAESVSARRRRPVRALLRKEFQSQLISLLIAFGLLVFHVCTLISRGFSSLPGRSELRFALEAAPCLWFLMPWLIGCMAVAEERKLGTLEGQLCLPVRRRLQFIIKFCVVFFFGMLLGGIIPWVIESIGIRFHISGNIIHSTQPLTSNYIGAGALGWSWPSHILNIFLQYHVGELVFLLAVAAAITIVSFFASTFTRSTLHALGVAVVFGGAFLVLYGWMDSTSVLDPSRSTFILWKGNLIFVIGIPVLLAAILWRSFSQFKVLHVSVRTVLRTVATLVFALLLSAVATSAMYQRAWELVTPLEPRHGPPQLKGSATPKICFNGPTVFALLPDGRLWASTAYTNVNLHSIIYREPQDDDTYLTSAPLERMKLRCPVGGTFIDGSNWTDIASSGYGVVGVQSDGTLWKVLDIKPGVTNLENPPEFRNPSRIGSDSNWQSVCGIHRRFLALKKDGTIWSAGEADWEMYESPRTPDRPAPHGWTRVGTASDWVNVFASGHSSFGVKSNGTVLEFVGDGHNWTPVGLKGTNWVSIQLLPGGLVALRDDGTVWAEERFRSISFLGNILQSDDLFGDRYPVSRKPVRLDPRTFHQIVGEHILVGLTSDGTILQNRIDALRNPWGQTVWRPSRYNDWIAIDSQPNGVFIGLAADGTLTFWRDPYSRWAGDIGNHWMSLGIVLSPTRAPTWSVNILASAK